MTKENKMTLWNKIRVNLILLAVFIIVLLLVAFLMRRQLIESARNMNDLLLEYYSSVEENRIDAYRTMLTLGIKLIDEEEQENASLDEIQDSLYPFLDQFNYLYASDEFRSYGVIGGYIFSNDEDYDGLNGSAYDYEGREWYSGALEADGEIYVTDAYADYITGESVVTMSQRAEHSDTVLAFDVFFSKYDSEDALNLPQNGAYYLCDASGTVIYSQTNVYDNYGDIQSFVKQMFEALGDEIGNGYLSSYQDANGRIRSASTRELDNGWVIILTIPQENAVAGMRTFYLGIGAVFLIGVCFILYLVICDYRRETSRQKLLEERKSLAHNAQILQTATRSTLQAYFAVYFLDLEQDTCEMIYPENHIGEKKTGYQSTMRDMFADGQLCSEEREGAQQVLGLENIRKQLAGKDFMEIRCRYRNKSGALEACVLTITAADYVDGRPVSATLAIRSIENMLREEAAQRELLVLATQRAEAANYAKSDFLSRMSHDIRTPMNAILGMTAIATMHIDDRDRVADALGKITLSGRHLLGLINSVLDMSKIESGKINLAEEEFNLSDSVESLLTLCHMQIKAKDLELKVQVEALEHEDVIGDGQRLQQIFTNILSNAIKFTPEGGTIALEIRERPSKLEGMGCYEFVFSDNGIGMEKEFIDRIFEPFSRAADSRTTKIEGTGLGMPIALNIARMMDGDIRVESEPGKGSRFTVTVYLKINHVTGADLQMLTSLPVLVVDDEKAACESTCEVLNSLGMKAEYVLNGNDAVAAVSGAHQKAADFSVVILDWKMPDKDGVETAREIRKYMGDSVPIIILSAYDWADVEQEAAQAGVNAFIEKPLFKSRLTHVLKDVMGLQQAAEKESDLDTFRKHDYAGRRALLVDDNDLNLEVAAELLEAVGLEVEMARNGKEAVDTVSGKRAGYYDVVFMDIQMPVMNGYDAAKAIRALGRADLKTLPIIAMTADAFAEDTKRAHEAGMNGHIAKPVDIPKLERMLEKWVH